MHLLLPVGRALVVPYLVKKVPILKKNTFSLFVRIHALCNTEERLLHFVFI